MLKARKQWKVRDIGVYPRDENVRRFIKHPVGKRGFENFPEATPWPDDQFTKRRLLEGSVLNVRPQPFDSVAGVGNRDPGGHGGNLGAAGAGDVPAPGKDEGQG